MKKLLLTLMVIFINTFLIAQSWRPGEMQIAIPINQPHINHLAGLVTEMKLNTEPAGNLIRAYLVPAEADALRIAEIEFTTEIADLNVWSASFGPRGVPSGYYTVDELIAIADSLALNFPDICTIHTLGTSTGFYQLKALKISDNSALDENESEVLFDGGIHGDEIGGPENMIRFARDLCLDYGSDEYITSLVDNREIWIYYMVNPYGRANMTRYNGNGIDINRDCGYMWNGEGNSPAAFSQPETKAYRNLLTENQFAIHCSYHSGTEYISYPWSYRADPTPDHPIHDYLASLYASNSGYIAIPYGQGFTGMYAINGSTKDFGYGSMGSISWSIEISVSKQPPASQIVPYYLKNKQSMLTMVEYAGYGIQGLVTDSITGQPVAATVFINNYFPFANDPVVGDYHKFLLPGNYDITISANGYQSRTISGISVSSLETTEVNTELAPLNKHFATRIIACQIPNNNFNDEGSTPAALGAPDNIQYSLGRFGYVTIDMGDTISDLEGMDVFVYENDDTPEGYQVLAGPTMDGPWYIMGNGIGSGGFDLNGSGLASARFLKIKDDGDGQSQVANAGFDLDAVEGIVYSPPMDSTGFIQGYLYSYVWPQPVAGATVNCGNYSTLSDEYGHYIIEADTGKVEICAEYVNWYMYDCDSVNVTSGDTLTHDMYLPIWEGVAHHQTPETDYKVYPNPADDYTTIYPRNLNEIFSCEVFSIDGRLIYFNRENNRGSNVSISTGNLETGIYIIRINNLRNITTLKLIINK